jgi:hypothetical protein
MGFTKVGGVAARTAVRERYRMRTLATDPRTQVIASSEAAATLRGDFAANLLQVQQTKQSIRVKVATRADAHCLRFMPTNSPPFSGSHLAAIRAKVM